MFTTLAVGLEAFDQYIQHTSTRQFQGWSKSTLTVTNDLVMNRELLASQSF
ncbi:hypothetical protein D3C87_2064490 [compost metagenome]